MVDFLRFVERVDDRLLSSSGELDEASSQGDPSVYCKTKRRPRCIKALEFVLNVRRAN